MDFFRRSNFRLLEFNFEIIIMLTNIQLENLDESFEKFFIADVGVDMRPL